MFLQYNILSFFFNRQKFSTWNVSVARNKSIEHENGCNYMTVDCDDVRYVFQNESTLWNRLYVKKLLARNKCNILRLSVCHRIPTHNHYFCKQTLEYLAKLVAASLEKWFSIFFRNYAIVGPNPLAVILISYSHTVNLFNIFTIYCSYYLQSY